MARPTAKAPWWMIVRGAGGHRRAASWEAFTVRCGGEEALAVFGFGEEAELFLGLEGLEPAGWHVRKTSCGEIASLLCGLCAGAGRVVLDTAATWGGGEASGLVCVDKKRFLARLLSEGERNSREKNASAL